MQQSPESGSSLGSAAATDSQADTTSVASGTHVLYVDPDSEAAARVASTLEHQSRIDSVWTVTSAETALDQLEAHPIDCVISEQTVPGESGLELFDTVRDRYADLPFVLYTSSGSERLASEALSAGVTEYISKGRTDPVERLNETVADILERRHATRRLTEAEADEFRTLADGIEDHAIFLLDPDGYVSSWNCGAENLKGYRQEDILGRHFSTFYPDGAVERGKPTKLLEAARTQGRVTDEGWRVTKSGTHFWASVVITVLRDDDGAVRGFAKFTRDLTEQRERERQLRENHQLTERILDVVPVGVAVHSPEGDLIRANARARDILDLYEAGYEEAPAEGEPGTVYDENGEPLEPSDLPTSRVLETGEPVYDTELAIERQDGSLLWVSVNAVPMFDESQSRVERIVTAGRDITALKTRERELEETHRELQATIDQLEITENRFEALTNNSSVAVLSIDGSSTVQFANETVEDVFGYEADELVGESLTKLIPERLVSTHLDAIDRYLDEGERHLDWDWVEVPGQHEQGHEIDLGLSFGETYVDSDHLFTAVIRDISAQKQQQRELERRREELNELVEELERSNAELEQFAYAVSHDLKEPLRMVSSYLDLLERRYGDELDQDAHEFIEYAVDGAERMRRMIDEILEFSKVGRDDSTHEPVDCTAVLEEVVGTLDIESADATVTVESLPTVRGNRTQLTKLFQNLLSNAITHSEEPVEIEVSATEEGDQWLLSVSDTGPGIPPESQERIFDLFTSIGSSGGTGVGLALCNKIVEYHGGSIRVESTPGEGTTFEFTLPDAAAADGEAIDSSTGE